MKYLLIYLSNILIILNQSMRIPWLKSFLMKIITRSDSILIYVNDKPNIKDNQHLRFGGDDFTHKFLSVDKNVDSKLTYYFLNDSLNG